MIYQILRFPLVVLFYFYYRRIYILNKKNIPSSAPTLIASNHSTAFMEQILVAGLQWRSIYFWARGSVFEEKWSFPSIFRQAHLIPIWRPEEGFKKMHRNKQIFEASKGSLLEGNMLYISPEGNAVPEKRLRTFKTGTARIALLTAAAKDFEEDVFIVPTGVNYTYHCDFRSEVIMSYGEPINVKNYKELYLINEIAAAKQLTEDLKEALTQEVIIINNKEDERLVEQLHVMLRNEHQFYNDSTTSNNQERLAIEQAPANLCNNLDEDQKLSLGGDTTAYFNTLQKNNLTDKAVEQKGSFLLGKAIKSVVLSPFALLGWIGGALPVKAARYLRNSNVEDKQFWAPMAVVFSIPVWLVYSLVICITAAFWLGWAALLLPFALIGLQYVAFRNKEDWNDVLANARYSSWKKKNPAEAHNLEEDRKEILHKFEELKSTVKTPSALK
ncbi:MAG: hypothetical protein GY810_04700 [Aureispira sp.]|nr:hypothetical protein [Aureispira sp.]